MCLHINMIFYKHVCLDVKNTKNQIYYEISFFYFSRKDDIITFFVLNCVHLHSLRYLQPLLFPVNVASLFWADRIVADSESFNDLIVSGTQICLQFLAHGCDLKDIAKMFLWNQLYTRRRDMLFEFLVPFSTCFTGRFYIPVYKISIFKNNPVFTTRITVNIHTARVSSRRQSVVTTLNKFLVVRLWRSQQV